MASGLFCFKVLMLVFVVTCINQVCSQGIFDVKAFGAVGDGKTEDTDVSFKFSVVTGTFTTIQCKKSVEMALIGAVMFVTSNLYRITACIY